MLHVLAGELVERNGGRLADAARGVGGFGWQVWAGAGLPLDDRTRLTAELFFNGCEVGSEVDVNIPDYGRATVRDVVKMNGVGMRLGVSVRF